MVSQGKEEVCLLSLTEFEVEKSRGIRKRPSAAGDPDQRFLTSVLNVGVLLGKTCCVTL